MDTFMSYWFDGFQNGLETLGKNEQTSLLAECGKACSKSYSLAVYQKLRTKGADDLSSFFASLATEISAVAVTELSQNSFYEIRYQRCLCDLYTQEYVRCGAFCECSRQSLLYNLCTVFPEYTFSVELVTSILRGGKECLLRIRAKPQKT